MTTLKERIARLAEFDEKRAQILMEASVERFFWRRGNVQDELMFMQRQEHSRLMPLIVAMADRIQELEVALGFYADYMNYSIDYDTSNHGFSRRCILYSDIEERNAATGLAGKRARQALAASPLDALLQGEK